MFAARLAHLISDTAKTAADGSAHNATNYTNDKAANRKCCTKHQTYKKAEVFIVGFGKILAFVVCGYSAGAFGVHCVPWIHSGRQVRQYVKPTNAEWVIVLQHVLCASLLSVCLLKSVLFITYCPYRTSCIHIVWIAPALCLLCVFREPVYSKPSHMAPIPTTVQWKSARWRSQVRGNWWEANGAKMAKTGVWVQQRCNRLNLVLIWLCIVGNRKCDWLVQGMMLQYFCIWFYTVCIKLFYFSFWQNQCALLLA